MFDFVEMNNFHEDRLKYRYNRILLNDVDQIYEIREKDCKVEDVIQVNYHLIVELNFQYLDKLMDYYWIYLNHLALLDFVVYH